MAGDTKKKETKASKPRAEYEFRALGSKPKTKQGGAERGPVARGQLLTAADAKKHYADVEAACRRGLLVELATEKKDIARQKAAEKKLLEERRKRRAEEQAEANAK